MAQHDGSAHRVGVTRYTTLSAAAVVGLVVVAISFATSDVGGPASGNRAPAGSDADGHTGELIARSTVLEDGTHGPQLCLGGVMESLPPQCGGPDLVGWDWNVVGGFERAGDSRWGEFVVIGTHDAAAHEFTLTRPAVPAAEYDGTGLSTPKEDAPVWRTPCPEPEDGWQVVDPALTSQQHLDQTLRLARSRPDFSAAWVDQSINPSTSDGDPGNDERLLNDPSRLVLNVAVTSDPRPVEAELRQTWGGALCVSQAQHTERALNQIQHQVSSLPGLLSSVVSNDRVEANVVWDDGAVQRELDQKFGPDTVVVRSALRPFRS